MTTYVVDASVAAKWFVPEIHAERAEALLASTHELLGPALLQIELGNAFLKFVRRGDMSVNEARTALDQVSRDVRVRSAASLVERAFQIGLDHQRSAYDGLYVALAIDEGLQLVTADRKLYDATNSAFPDTLLWIEDL